ncbi:unnamed protein product [Dibothriocephalus latus]|uniref:Nuclear pore complex protein NUP96 C-terminal domain-containing protein n=1 Tax=Dibothriocephalus latus TaxID=60516 RepID=A0A3P7L0V6_DIBLA|nr:unnamed protein product [Dibothriocephalus latus]
MELCGPFFDAGLPTGGSCRVSWSCSRVPNEHYQLVVSRQEIDLRAFDVDPSMPIPAVTSQIGSVMVITSLKSPMGPEEEVLLASALQTSQQSFDEEVDGETPFCPKLLPTPGLKVLESYLASRDLVGATADQDSPQFSRLAAFYRAVEIDQLRPWMLLHLKELGLSNLLEFTQSQDAEPIAKLRDLWSTGANLSRQNLFEGIFACLCCGETGLACRIAVAGQLPSMAIVLSQAPNGDPQFKHDILRQLQTWHELKMDKRIPKVILSIYALLAGQIHLPHPDYANEVLDILEGVSYQQALGVHLWYLTDYTTGLLGALKLFSENWHSLTTAVAPPCPPTVTDLHTAGKPRSTATAIGMMQPRVLKSRDWPRDVAYHLLRLKCRRWHSLERTLDPTSFLLRQGDCLNRNTPALSDWSASWHLWRVLYALGYRQLNPLATSRLHSEFACQLESSGLWHWAIFVLLHEQDPRVRASSVKQVIGRHVSLQPRAVLSQGKENEFFHLDDPDTACLARSRLAGLPFSAKARRRRHLFASLEAAHWLAADHVDAAHDVCLRHLLPDFILHSESSATLLPTSANFGKSKASGLLASRLLSVLKPFIQLPPEKSPSSFNTGKSAHPTSQI